jgi:hypothetical protein
MNENPTPEPENAPGEIADELRQLGQNLRQVLENAWGSEQRKKLQQEIESGLSDLGVSLSQAARDFAEGSTGQALKADIEDLGQRIRSGEVENKVRGEVLDALRTVNHELKKATRSSPPPPEPPAENG